ncbi:MAG: hypothetical protein JWM74_3436, partial [Myxococcaceae bacterium]|nr:hypothetical protein [Myxococcaceae bacterium]
MKLTEHRCGWDKTCPPLTPWYVQFSNPIDLKAFDKKMIKVDPELPGMKITTSGQSITLSGRAKGKTTYKVTFASAVPDVFEQTLGKDETVTFDVGPAVPALFAEDKEMMVSDPSGGGKVPVFSVNQPGIRVRLYAVKPEDFRRYQEWRQKWDYEQKNPEPPGRLMLTTTIKPSGAADALAETPIDLAPALTKGVGQVIVIAEGTAPPRYPGQRDWFRSWVQVTGIGLDAFVDHGEALAWTTSLSTGAPLGGVEVGVASGMAPVKSSADGLARLQLAMTGEVLTARVGNDVAFITDPYGQSFKKSDHTDQVRWFVFDDRKTYKPGEEVRIKGWVRRAGMGKGGDLGFVTGAKSATWTVTDPRNNEIGKGTSTLDASGGLDATFKLPDAANLGYAQVHLHLEGASGVENVDHTHGFSVQEFRRPEFEVNAQAPAGPHYVGGNTVATVAATYYAGGGLPSAQVDWRVSRSDASFTPPNRSEYSFGRGPLGWGWMQARARSSKKRGAGQDEPPPTTETWTSKTDALGKHRLRIDFDALDPPYAMDLALQASVTDVNRQAWTAQASVLVHPASEYVGLKQQKSFVRAGESIQVDAIVV